MNLTSTAESCAASHDSKACAGVQKPATEARTKRRIPYVSLSTSEYQA